MKLLHGYIPDPHEIFFPLAEFVRDIRPIQFGGINQDNIHLNENRILGSNFQLDLPISLSYGSNYLGSGFLCWTEITSYCKRRVYWIHFERGSDISQKNVIRPHRKAKWLSGYNWIWPELCIEIPTEIGYLSLWHKNILRFSCQDFWTWNIKKYPSACFVIDGFFSYFYVTNRLTENLTNHRQKVIVHLIFNQLSQAHVGLKITVIKVFSILFSFKKILSWIHLCWNHWKMCK